MKKFYVLVLGIVAIGCAQTNVFAMDTEQDQSSQGVRMTSLAGFMFDKMVERYTFDEAVNKLVSGYWDTISDRPVNRINEMLLVRVARKALAAKTLSIDGIKNDLRIALVASGKMKSEAAVEDYVEQLAARIQRAPVRFTSLYQMGKQALQGEQAQQSE